jgi:type IV fimbrial biogenesis protein FimT
MQQLFEGRRALWRQRSRCRGFSLVELLIVTVLAASAAALAGPMFSAWQARDRVDSAARALLASLTFARGEAIARGAPVVVCPVGGTPRCLTAGRACARNAPPWSCGWAVIVEQAGIGKALRVHSRLTGVSIAAARSAVAFTPPAGQVIGGFRHFEFTAADVRVEGNEDRLRRCIRIAAGGRARLAHGGCHEQAGA